MTKIQKPVILNEGTHTPADLARLRAKYSIWKERDIYRAQLKELFEITHPHLLKESNTKTLQNEFVREHTDGQKTKLRGSWIYYPWSGVLLHTLAETPHVALMTNRNRDLITPDEQKKLQDFRVAIVGLSVGSNVATALAYGGIGKTIKLAEFDTLETSNLNRIRARIDHVGMLKAAIVAQQLYEVNPYLNLAFLTDGLNKKTLSEFVLGDPKPQLIFEIMDSFEMKIQLRLLARKHRIPVVMTTNLGDRLLVDIERHDLDGKTEFFNGRAGRVPEQLLKNPDRTAAEKHAYAILLAGGKKNIPQKAIDSVAAIGKHLVGRPQLGSTVTISGGVGAYIARKIALGEKLPSGSWLMDLDTIFSRKSLFDISK